MTADHALCCPRRHYGKAFWDASRWGIYKVMPGGWEVQPPGAKSSTQCRIFPSGAEAIAYVRKQLS